MRKANWYSLYSREGEHAIRFCNGVWDMGAVLHPVNVRSFADHILHIMNRAEDKITFLDDDFIPLVEGLRKG